MTTVARVRVCAAAVFLANVAVFCLISGLAPSPPLAGLDAVFWRHQILAHSAVQPSTAPATRASDEFVALKQRLAVESADAYREGALDTLLQFYGAAEARADRWHWVGLVVRIMAGAASLLCIVILAALPSEIKPHEQAKAVD